MKDNKTFTVADASFFRNNARRAEKCLELQEAFENERALLFKDNTPLFNMISNHTLECVNSVRWYYLDVTRGSLYYNYYDVTDPIFAELKKCFSLRQNTFCELIGSLRNDNNPRLEETIGDMIAKALWDFPSHEHSVEIKCIRKP